MYIYLCNYLIQTKTGTPVLSELHTAWWMELKLRLFSGTPGGGNQSPSLLLTDKLYLCGSAAEVESESE